MASDRGTPRQGSTPVVPKQRSVISVGSQSGSGNPTTPEAQSITGPPQGYPAAPYGMYPPNVGMTMHPHQIHPPQVHPHQVHHTHVTAQCRGQPMMTQPMTFCLSTKQLQK